MKSLLTGLFLVVGSVGWTSFALADDKARYKHDYAPGHYQSHGYDRHRGRRSGHHYRQRQYHQDHYRGHHYRGHPRHGSYYRGHRGHGYGHHGYRSPHRYYRRPHYGHDYACYYDGYRRVCGNYYRRPYGYGHQSHYYDTGDLLGAAAVGFLIHELIEY